MNRNLKEKILELRSQNKTYREIKSILNCSLSTVASYCNTSSKNKNKFTLKGDKNSEENIKLYQSYYNKTKNLSETANYFGVSRFFLRKHVNKEWKSTIKNTYYKEVKKLAVEYKGGKCERCGYDKSLWSLDFHHIDPEKKDFQISKGSKKNWEVLKKELDKCILLCKNCHGEEHEKIYKLKNMKKNVERTGS